MSKAFSLLKDPKLGFLDVLPVGKYKGCRVQDILEDVEYIRWLIAHTSIKFQPAVLDKMLAEQLERAAEEHYVNEIAPYAGENPWYIPEDIPF
jgi:uncharacterized protein (DUF3820 family)